MIQIQISNPVFKTRSSKSNDRNSVFKSNFQNQVFKTQILKPRFQNPNFKISDFKIQFSKPSFQKLNSEARILKPKLQNPNFKISKYKTQFSKAGFQTSGLQNTTFRNAVSQIQISELRLQNGIGAKWNRLWRSFHDPKRFIRMDLCMSALTDQLKVTKTHWFRT